MLYIFFNKSANLINFLINSQPSIIFISIYFFLFVMKLAGAYLSFWLSAPAGVIRDIELFTYKC